MRSLAALVVVVSACGTVEHVQTDAAPLCTATSCDDGDRCTDDSCEVTGCKHVAMSCDDGDPMTMDTCDPIVACTHKRTFAFTGALQMFTVPGGLTSVRITANGAQGGGANGALPGGMGASIAGTFNVASGDQLTILVGGKGIDGSATVVSQRGGSGGGGTFVVESTMILVIAGGGGGAVGNVPGSGPFGVAPGGPGQTSTAGQASGNPTPYPGGTAGGGGTTNPNTAYHGATGGGGYSGDGINNSAGDTTAYGTVNTPGKSFTHGGAGGIGGSQGRNGGFGGGGAAGYTGGGGGGYSGGGAGPGIPSGTEDHSGGGGGSMNNGTSPTNAAGMNAGDGSVTISW
jgi:hypothetical protein